MLYESIIGQKETVNMLRQQADGSMPHALLFYGPEGTGKLIAALGLAQHLLCRSTGQQPCGHCNSCQKVEKFIHPDLHFLLPTTAGKLSTEVYSEWREVLSYNPYLNAFQWLQQLNAERKQGNISAKDCLQMIKLLSMQSFEGGAKVFIIWMAEYLGREGNRLLKLIEEPPEKTYIILIAENRELILPTIKSRAQQIYFKPLRQEDIASQLVNRFNLAESEARSTALLAEGNYNVAQSLVIEDRSDYEDNLKQWIRVVAMNDASRRLEWSNAMGGQSKEFQKAFIRYAIQIFRDGWHRSLGMKSGNVKGEMEKVSQFLNEKLGSTGILNMIEKMDKSIGLITRNVNSKMLWLNLSVNMKQGFRKYHALLMKQKARTGK